jgi:hypothetical protein
MKLNKVKNGGKNMPKYLEKFWEEDPLNTSPQNHGLTICKRERRLLVRVLRHSEFTSQYHVMNCQKKGRKEEEELDWETEARYAAICEESTSSSPCLTTTTSELGGAITS